MGGSIVDETSNGSPAGVISVEIAEPRLLANVVDASFPQKIGAPR
jgi:hypothetical protein